MIKINLPLKVTRNINTENRFYLPTFLFAELARKVLSSQDISHVDISKTDTFDPDVMKFDALK